MCAQMRPGDKGYARSFSFDGGKKGGRKGAASQEPVSAVQAIVSTVSSVSLCAAGHYTAICDEISVHTEQEQGETRRDTQVVLPLV